MNKSDLINKIAERNGLNTLESKQVLNSILQEITGSVQAGEPVTIKGFGAFYPKDKSAYVARDPRGSRMLNVPANRKMKFRAAKRTRRLLD